MILSSADSSASKSVGYYPEKVGARSLSSGRVRTWSSSDHNWDRACARRGSGDLAGEDLALYLQKERFGLAWGGTAADVRSLRSHDVLVDGDLLALASRDHESRLEAQRHASDSQRRCHRTRLSSVAGGQRPHVLIALAVGSRPEQSPLP
jgi:hypothetical protein